MQLTLKTIAIGGVALLAIGGGIWGYQVTQSETTSLDINAYHTVTRADLTVTVTESGELKAVREYPIINPLSGNSKIIFITPQGTIVNEGDKIVELDAETMRESRKKLELEIETSKTSKVTAQNNLLIDQSTSDSDIRNAKKDIIFAEMDLQKFREFDNTQQLRNAETDISNAEDAYKLSSQRFGWSEKLAQQGFETKSQVDRDKLDVNLKTKALETAKNKLQTLIKFDLPKQKAELDSKVTEAIKKHERVIKQGDSKVTLSKAALASAERKLKLNLEQLADIDDKLSKVILKAPASGMVLYKQVNRRHSNQAPIEKGATVTKNQELVVIPDLSKMKVRLKVPEFHISKIKNGQLAHVTIESIRSDRLKAKVISVSAVPDKENSWFSTGDKFYLVEVLITDPLPDVKPSVSAKVEIITHELKDTLLIPIQSIYTEKGKYYCFTKDGGDTKKEVQLGVINNSYAQVLDGIQQGDEILLTAP